MSRVNKWIFPLVGSVTTMTCLFSTSFSKDAFGETNIPTWMVGITAILTVIVIILQLHTLNPLGKNIDVLLAYVYIGMTMLMFAVHSVKKLKLL